MLYSTLRLLSLLIRWIDWLLLTLVLYLLSYVPRRFMAPLYDRLFRTWCRHFVRALNVDLRLHQHNSRDLPGHYLLIANHPSAFEDIGIPALFPVDSVAKDSVRRWWIVGRISVAAGTLFVVRKDRASRRAVYQLMIERLAAGRNVAVYPEGGCFGRRISPTFHYGPFDISLQTGVPILPVFIHYEAQDDFEWGAGESLPQKIRDFLFTRNNRANYHVFDPIEPAGFAGKEEYMEYVHRQYQHWQARFLE